MPKINILTERDSWICRRSAEELKPLGWTINEPEGQADVDYYLPYTLWQAPGHNLQVAYFTHLEVGVDHNCRKKAKKFFVCNDSIDKRIAISQKTASLLKPKNADAVIMMASQFSKQITFGVCGKVHKSGRKNERFIEQLVLAGYDVCYYGSGWAGREYQGSLEQFYRDIDYLIIPSSIEGGPVPVLEALSLGCAVIAPDVGWCFEFGVIPYRLGCYSDLERVVKSLAVHRTWENWRDEHREFFGGILPR